MSRNNQDKSDYYSNQYNSNLNSSNHNVDQHHQMKDNNIMQIDNNISNNNNNNKPQYRIVTGSEYEPSVPVHSNVSIPYYQQVYHQNISPPTTPTSDDVHHIPFSFAPYPSTTSPVNANYYQQPPPHSPLPPIYNTSLKSSPVSSPTGLPISHQNQQPFSHVINQPTPAPFTHMKIKIPQSNIGSHAILLSPRDLHHPQPNITYQIQHPPHSPHHPPHSPHHPPHSPHHPPLSPHHPPHSPNINNSGSNDSFYNQYGVDSGQLTPTSIPPNLYTTVYSTYSQPFTTAYPQQPPPPPPTPVQVMSSPRDKDGNEVLVSPGSNPPPNHLFYTHSYPHLHQIYENKNKNPNFPSSSSTPALNNYQYYLGNKLQTVKKSNTVVPLLSKFPPPQQPSQLSPKTGNINSSNSSMSSSGGNINNSSSSGVNNGGVNSTTLSSSSSSILPPKNKFSMLKHHQSLPLLPIPGINTPSTNNNVNTSGSNTPLNSSANLNNSNINTNTQPSITPSTSNYSLSGSHDSIDSPLTPMSSPSISSLSINTSISPLSTPPVTPPLLLGPGSSPQNSPRNPNSPRIDPIAVQHNQLQALKKHYDFLLTKFLSEIWSSIDNDTYLEASKSFKNFSIPLARIKKIMKSDPTVKMISSDAPILFVKAIEIFILELTARAWVHTELSKRKTLQRSDMIHAIARVETFDFLVDIVSRDEIKPKKIDEASKSSFLNSPEGYQYLQYLQLQNYLQETKRQNSIRIESNSLHSHNNNPHRLKFYYQPVNNNNTINSNNNNNINNSRNQMSTINEEAGISYDDDDDDDEDEDDL